MKVRTRFAPSPTGYLHIGGVRTALYAWLYARKYQGQFILRIEDTDRERSTPEAVAVILEGLQWLGLDMDEGPYFQSQRLPRYQQLLDKLLIENKAYRCYCSKERLTELRRKQLAEKKKPRYDGYCRDHPPIFSKELYAIRFRNPLEGQVRVDDQVHGEVIFKNQELDDVVIARNDGFPTYNFTVVVDDWDMEITHVIRGDDHLNNTPRQINLLLALGADIPIYAHVPMLLDSSGRKLSKREGAANILKYREEGYLPEALLNYLIRLGWSHGDQEIFSREEMISYFDLTRLNKAPAAINLSKLVWLNQHYMKIGDTGRLAFLLGEEMQRLHIHTEQGPHLNEIVTLQRERVKNLREMAEKSRYFYEAVVVDKTAIPNEVFSVLKMLRTRFSELDCWSDPDIHQILLTTAAEFSLKPGKLIQPLRLILTGEVISPPINTILRLIGKKEVLARLNDTLAVF